MTKHLNRLYKNFIREKVNQEYIYRNENCKILGESFVKNYYCILIQDWNNVKSKTFSNYHLIIENCKNPKIYKFKPILRNDRYIRVEKSELYNNQKIFELFIKQGLFKNPDKAFNKINNQILIHRLCLCLYTNIIGLEVHHNNKDKSFNAISNLSPIKKEYHLKLDSLTGKDFVIETEKIHKEFTHKYFKEKRNTLSSRDNIVLNILQDIQKNLTITTITKKYSKYASQSTIKNIKRHYFYVEQFLDYLYKLIKQGNPAFVNLSTKQWDFILDFEKQNQPKNINTYDIPNFLKLHIREHYKKT